MGGGPEINRNFTIHSMLVVYSSILTLNHDTHTPYMQECVTVVCTNSARKGRNHLPSQARLTAALSRNQGHWSQNGQMGPRKPSAANNSSAIQAVAVNQTGNEYQ